MAIVWPANKVMWAEIGDETRCFFCAKPLDPRVAAVQRRDADERG